MSSRHQASILRAEIEQAVLSGNKACVDFTSVLSVSHAFADEMFGVLAARHGLEWLTAYVTLHNTSSLVFRSLADAIHYRLSASEPAVPDAGLLQARHLLEKRMRT